MKHRLLKVTSYCLVAAASLGPVCTLCGTPGAEEVDTTAPPAGSAFNLPDYWPPSAGRLYGIAGNDADGTQIRDAWNEDGGEGGENRAGLEADGSPVITALRFIVPDLRQGEPIAFARLRLSSAGTDMSGPLTLTITGLAPGSDTFSSDRLPSSMPATDRSVTWRIPLPWTESRSALPLYYASPDISPIINEMVMDPRWGEDGGAIAFAIQGSGTPTGQTECVKINDFTEVHDSCNPALLEICREVSDTFLAQPILGRPTDRSVTLNIMSLVDVEAYAAAGTEPGAYTTTTPPVAAPAGSPLEIVIDGLTPDTAYNYQVMYRRAGADDFVAGWTGNFHTQRARGDTYIFTIQADSHIVGNVRRHNARNLNLYGVTLGNVLADKPDFHISMGDFAHMEFYTSKSTSNLADGIERYLVQRGLMGELGRQTPFFLCLGNHEAEQGWRRGREDDSLEVWGTLARKITFPNPYPDAFYSGNTDSTACCGLREDYYAWEWGDGLFVVIDPFWYTVNMPHRAGAYMPTEDAWDWTLGKQQYDWLYSTLAGSDAEWKFVFTHHLVGGVTDAGHENHPYGRGGIDAAKYKVSGRPTFEWGGEDSSGEYVFGQKRPGWDHGAIHDILVETGVDILFHGHDHAFVREELDGVVYQECPVPSAGNYSSGFFGRDFYTTGDLVNNSGHLRVTVSQDSVRVEYVRAVLPEDQPLYEDGKPVRNGTVSYSYLLRR
jgi:hypothetical protein